MRLRLLLAAPLLMGGRGVRATALICAAIGLSTVAANSVAISASHKLGPSFHCDGHQSLTEQRICNDPELSAWDRGLAFIYAKVSSTVAARSAQRKWLARRDACGKDDDCIYTAYGDRIEELNGWQKIGPVFKRRIAPDAHASDLMLGTLQSPSGKVKFLGDYGDLSIRALGGDWYMFNVIAYHSYDPHDGLGANATTAEMNGFVHLVRGEATIGDPVEESSCVAKITRLGDGAWKMEDNWNCGGLGATLTGIYRR